MHVEARDRVGVHLGRLRSARTLPSGTPFFSADSIAVPASTSSVTHTFRMKLQSRPSRRTLQVSGVRAQREGTRDYARKPVGNAARFARTRSTVVAGPHAHRSPAVDSSPTRSITRHQRIYLSNIERNELEVFNLADSTFQTPIQVGSRPWGIAAWPRDRDGTMGDTLLVANSGGTLISYVNTEHAAERGVPLSAAEHHARADR